VLLFENVCSNSDEVHFVWKPLVKRTKVSHFFGACDSLKKKHIQFRKIPLFAPMIKESFSFERSFLLRIFILKQSLKERQFENIHTFLVKHYYILNAILFIIK